MILKNRTIFGLIVLLTGLLAGCNSFTAGGTSDPLFASGVIETNEISVAPELSGKIAEVFVQEGSSVIAGELLFTLENDLLLKQKAQAEAVHQTALAQREGARAGIQLAQAELDRMQSTLIAAEIQYELVLAFSLLENDAVRVDDWNQSTSRQIEIPAWYFQQEEQILAAETEVSKAWDFFQSELAKLQDTLSKIENGEFSRAEIHLAEAQAAFEVAEVLKDQRTGYDGKEYIADFIDTIFEKAETELEAAQKSYDQILTDPQYEEVLEVRARVSVAKERYDIARFILNDLFQGDYSLDVRLAETVINQAKAGLLQAEAQLILAKTNLESASIAVQQTEAALGLIELQLEQLQVRSPISGTILTSIINSGEIISAGLTAVSIGDLLELSVTVYLPEDKYGMVNLGDRATLTVDSYPADEFEAIVVRISDQAEYTPRNVQTQEERQNTVYAVKLSLTNLSGKLKPGMPADVEFHP